MESGARLTPRVVLREPQADDAQTLCAYHVRNAQRYERWEPPRSVNVQDHAAWIAQRLAQSADGSGLSLLAFDRASPELLVGLASLDGITGSPQPSAMVSCSVDAAYEGRGYASEIVGALVTLATERGITKLDAHIDPQNVRSRALFARLGFETVAELLEVPPELAPFLRAHVLVTRYA